jgi:hypothetical protein
MPHARLRYFPGGSAVNSEPRPTSTIVPLCLAWARRDLKIMAQREKGQTVLRWYAQTLARSRAQPLPSHLPPVAILRMVIHRHTPSCASSKLCRNDRVPRIARGGRLDRPPRKIDGTRPTAPNLTRFLPAQRARQVSSRMTTFLISQHKHNNALCQLAHLWQSL